jgi:heterodisulfide reductase subunit B
MAHEYDISTRLVCEHLGIQLHEISDWNCCGATAAHSLDHHLSIGLSGRNLALVDDMKLNQVTTPCAGCFSRLKTATGELKKPSMQDEMEKMTGISLAGAKEVQVNHLHQLFDFGIRFDPFAIGVHQMGSRVST